MIVNVLLYQTGEDNEGIHSLEIKGKTIVLMFEDIDDAERYCGLLEAQDFPRPSVEQVNKSEIEDFCTQSGYETRLVEKGFIPRSQEDLLFISPPQSNLDVSNWDNSQRNIQENSIENDNLEDLRKKLEDLL